MRTLLLFFLVETLCLQVSAQRIIELPAAAEQTHPELIIERISIYNDSTVVQLSVENKMEQGGGSAPTATSISRTQRSG
jgi:biopolymer transport protein ExbD